MSNMYENLGDLLNEALDKGRLPPKNTKTSSEKEEPSFHKIENKTPLSEGKQSILYSKLTKEQKTAFDILHSVPEMTLEEIKKNYHELLILYHPDTDSNPDSSKEGTALRESQTQKLVEAFDIIKLFYSEYSSTLR